MFLLLKRLRAWRTDMLIAGDLTTQELNELEDHLQTEAECLVQQGGYSDDQAFHEAVRRLGAPVDLMQEFRTEHEMSRRLVFLPGLLRTIQWIAVAARNLLVFCLPSIAIASPCFAFAAQYKQLYDAMLSGAPMPMPTNLFFRITLLFQHCASLLILLLLISTILLLPSLIRAKQLRNSYQLSIPDFISEELDGVRSWLMWGVFVYPVLGTITIRILYAPLFTVVDMMGG